MSAQLIELLLFAGIAFVLINRLVSMLGTTEEDDPARKGSIFGEAGGLKDVTSYANNKSNNTKAIKDAKMSVNEELIVAENKQQIMPMLDDIAEAMGGFNLEKFVRGAKTVLKLVVKALKDQDTKALSALVDKRYIEQIPDSRSRYIDFKESINIDAKVSEVLTFGNSVIIKVLFLGKQFKEEWTFQKSLLSNSPDWYLTNTDVVE
jgi:predicted lipid-binding transport protein (Tim44 family)